MRKELNQAYKLMRQRFGHQHWWPGENEFEICIGAILTQNTAWSNVEKAFNNLRNAKVLTPQKLYNLPLEKLALLIKPAGYYNVKARRLRNFLEVLVKDFSGDLEEMLSGDLNVVRNRLLAIKGIGNETADSMLLYAGRHLSFVIDAYTKRIFYRHDWCDIDADYEDLKGLCEQLLKADTSTDLLDYWQDYHAQLVMVGKNFCKSRVPECENCPLGSLLPEKKK
ncbi:MAG TPA: endonuclease III domain-containing protein [Verrucomicrobiota bacterium]|nr:endonuclease III domain-containing protein [Verrucomicrobiota bacterium]